MVRLFDISFDKKTISCNYEPENSGKIGHVSVDVNTHEVTSVVFSEYEYGKKMYVSHVRSKLVELLSSTEHLPKSASAIWY